MLKRLSVVDFIQKIKEKTETNTGISCYTEMPEAVTVPCYYAEITGKRTKNTKTMWCETMTVWIHILTGESEGRTKANEMLDLLEEALTEAIPLEGEEVLISQESLGPVDRQIYEPKDGHMIIAYEFKISYGFKTK